MTHYTNTNNPIDFPKKKDIPLLEKFAVQSLVEHDEELIFSKEKFAELIVRECVRYFNEDYERDFDTLWREDLSRGIKQHFGVEE